MVWQSSTNEDTASPWWYDEGTPSSRTCFFNFPRWHRAKPRTLPTTFLILFFNRNHRSIVNACFYFNRNYRSTVSTGAIARLSLSCSSIEDPCSGTAICLLFSTVFFVYQSELSVTLVQSGSWIFHLYSRMLVSDPYGGHEHLPHECWASAANSLLPLNSRRVRFLFLGSVSRPMHSTTQFAKLFQFKCVRNLCEKAAACKSAMCAKSIPTHCVFVQCVIETPQIHIAQHLES